MAVNNRSVEAVIFDLDDTLIDWSQPTITREEFYKPRIARIHSFITSKGHKLPAVDEFFSLVDAEVFATWAEAKKTWQIPSFGAVLSCLFDKLGIDSNQIDINKVLRVFDWGARPGVILFPDTISVLETLQWRGYKIGLITNSFLPMWVRDAELESYDLIRYLDFRISAADVGYLKPHPSIFEKLLEEMQVDPKRTIFVGDRPKNDIAGANNAGLISVLMKPSHLDRDLDEVVPDYTVYCLGELLPILDDLETNGSSSG